MGWTPPEDDWQDRAACRPGAKFRGKPVDPDWWFPASPAGGAKGKWVCRTACPVRVECLVYARLHEVAGVWGGQDELERYGREVTHKPRER